MIDTHTHLQFDAYDSDRDDVLKRMLEAGVTEAIVVGVDEQTSARAVKLASQYPYLFASVGVHPGDSSDLDLDQTVHELEALIDPKTVAIGEIGLDYKVFDGVEPDRQMQARVFESMIELANNHDLPVILHSRLAESAVIDFIRDHPVKQGGVVHCYTADSAIAKEALDVGLMISFTAMITYPKNQDLREVVAKMPHERVMLETDCPFLPPEGLRGERNEPANVATVAKTVAELWSKDIDYVNTVTTANARKFFHLSNT